MYVQVGVYNLMSAVEHDKVHLRSLQELWACGLVESVREKPKAYQQHSMIMLSWHLEFWQHI